MLQADDALVSAMNRTRPAESEPEVFLHGDLRADQFLVDEHGSVHLIDGEEVCRGPARKDLVVTAGGIIFTCVVQALQDVPERIRDRGTSGSEDPHDAFLDATEVRLGEAAGLDRNFVRGYGPDRFRQLDRPALEQSIGFSILEQVLSRDTFSYGLSGMDRVLAGIARAMVLDGSSIDFLFDCDADGRPDE